MKDRNETSSNLACRLLDGSVSFERNDTCNWKNISIKTKEPTWFSFVSFSPIDGLLLVSKTNPPTCILITDDDYSLGPSPNPKDLKIQFQGAWLNDLTSKEVDAALASAIALASAASDHYPQKNIYLVDLNLKLKYNKQSSFSSIVS